MLRFLLLLFFSLLLVGKSLGQTPTILINGDEMTWQTCTDVPFQLPVIISGRYDPGNQFKIQIRYSSYGEVVTEIPATLVGNFLEFTFKDSDLYFTPTVQMRIVTSAPKTEGFWLEQGFQVYRKGNVSLTQVAFSDSVNLYDDYPLRVTGYSSSGGWATLGDSSKVQIPSTGAFNVLHQIVVVQEGPLTIAHAENECGAMTVSGSLRPVVNKTSIKTLQVDPQVLCEGSEVKVSFSVSGTALPANTRYRIRFSDTNSNDARPTSVDVPAELRDGQLGARFPDKFNIQYSGYFVAQVVTDNPATVASPSPTFVVSAKPSASFSTPSQMLNLGETTFVQVTLTGIPPFRVELSDGSVAVSANQGTVAMGVKPTQTTAYTIKSMSSGCSNPATLSDGVLEIKVNPGIAFANQTERQPFCGGTRASVKFISNAVLTASTQFWIEAKNQYLSTDHFRIPATRSGDQLSFDVPNRPEGYAGFAFSIVTANPSLLSWDTQLIEFQTLPGMTYRDYNIYDYKLPGNARFTYVLHGGPPYRLVKPEGDTLVLDSNGEHGYEFYLKQTREFRFKSISNSCFKNENLSAKTFRITGTATTTGISLEPLTKLVCANDSIEVTFQKFGTFNAGNQFEIQGMTECCEYKTLAKVSGDGKHRVKMAANRFINAASIRIASTSPIIYSELQEFQLQLLPEQFRLSWDGSPEAPVQSYPNQYISEIAVMAEKGLPSRIDYSENGQDKVFMNTSDQGTSIPISLVPGKVNEFVVKSATNICGTSPVNLKAYIYAIPYRITMPPTGNEGTYCAGGTITVPFGLVDPMTGKATFSLEIAKEGSTDFTSIAKTDNGRILSGKIPANADPGNYKVRITSTDNAKSPEQTIRIGTVPTAKLGSGAESEPLTTDAGQSANIKVTLTGGHSWTVIYEDNSKYNYGYAEETRSLSPARGGKFFIKSVSNICGYGTVSGSLAVKVNPGLRINSAPFNACEGGTFSLNYSLLGDVDLSDDFIRFELVHLSTNKVTLLDSTKVLSGTRSLKMPDELPAGQIQIRVVVRKYNLSSQVDVGFLRKPSAVLTGSTTINSGEAAHILVQSTKDNLESAQVTLSDGTRGHVSGMAGDYSYIQVSPKQTTTYSIASIKNSCGVGVASGSATVEVNPVSDKSISVINVQSTNGGGTCVGSEVFVYYTVKGILSAGNKMTVQISDSTGRNFRDIQTTGNTSPLKAIIPLDLPDGRLYRIRVAASDAGVSSGAFIEAFTVAKMAKARFSTESVLFDGSAAPRVKVMLEGGAPWAFQWGNDMRVQTVSTNNPEVDVELFNAAPGQLYKIFSVSNLCGAGELLAPAIVRVEVITGTGEPAWKDHIRIYPNPATDQLLLEFKNAAPRSIELFDPAGRSVQKIVATAREGRLDTSRLASGIYLVKVSENGRNAAYRIIKH